ncbi:MAG: alpha-L-fucosidase [Acutalibacteraceae bacterium]|nr:alpha-L-fucosidase [Acutalibacteraceae bacterium]
MDNKFGMFIHWGIYAVNELQEQELARYDVPNEEYEKLATVFNPVKYDPEEWVLMAKEAGMKYICFTTKHHDGFCMWDTKYTDYNIMNTPYGKDVLKMLADACQKHGMLLSLYYSNPDWHHPNSFNKNASHQWKNRVKKTDNFEAYIEYIKNQITELLTNYGPIYTLFWDISPNVIDPSVNELVRKLQTNIFINDRGFDKGDFSTPERDYTNTDEGAYFTRMTEACNALGEQSWGFRRDDDLNSLRYLTTAIDKIMAMNGSYLLNVGPKADGTIDPEQRVLLKKVGDWYNRMEGSLEDTVPDTFDYKVQKNKCIVNKRNGKSYFNFYEGICSSGVAIGDFPNLPKKVRLLNTGKELPFKTEILPEFLDPDTGKGLEFLHIQKIPVDDLANEPIVVEVEW